MAPVLRHCPCLRPENDDVKVLDYSHSNIEDVPNEVFGFERTLEELYLDANQIKDLPRPLFHCHGLRKLNLSDNEVQSLPPAVASLINLEQLDISKNGVLEIPDNIKGCKCLSMIDASVNPLGKLPEGFTQLINLQELYLNDTFLEYLPANFGRLCRLKILELRENHLKVLPKSMARLTDLSRLDIGQNDFTDLPEVIGNLPRLVELWCDCNNISCLPPFLGGLKKLAYLDASKNRIYDVADEIEGCSSLCDLTLSSNRIKELPDGIANLRKLTVLRVDSNRLTCLPVNIGNLIHLEEFVLSSNDLSKLPFTMGLLRNLKTLIADDNLLEELPCEMGSCQKLTILSLRDNKLLQIPDELGHISALKVINLSGNLLQYLPFSIAKLPNLQALWLSENQNKPLVPLQSDTDRMTGQKVLTCFMLPQVPLEEDGPPPIEGKEADDINPEGKGRQLIKFAFDLDKDQPSKLVRAPTPYPKELKAHARHARNYALKKQGFKECDINQRLDKNVHLNHANMEILRRKGAPPDIMVMPSGPPSDVRAKVKEAAVVTQNAKSPPASPSHPKKQMAKSPKERGSENLELQQQQHNASNPNLHSINTQSSVESSGSDVPVKALGRRDSRGDGSSSENTSSSPVASPKTSHNSRVKDQTAEGHFKKNSATTGSGKRDTWMRQRLLKQGSGDSDRGYRSDHEVYLAERDQYGIYGAHSDGYASDWEAFMAKQTYAPTANNGPMPHPYGRAPGPPGYRGNAEGQEIQPPDIGMFWPGYQYSEGQEPNPGEQYISMNQQGYWQTEAAAPPPPPQYYNPYDPNQPYQMAQGENHVYYYPPEETPVQPVEFYQPPAYHPSPPQPQVWPQVQRPPAPPPATVVGSRTLPRRIGGSSPRMKRAQCLSIQAPLHGSPQEYHLMPQPTGNIRQISPGNSPLPGRSPSPRMESKFSYPVPRIPSQQTAHIPQYAPYPITSQPINAVQFPPPPSHPAYYNRQAYQDMQRSYPPMTPPRMKHMTHVYVTNDQQPSYDGLPPGVHNSSYYAGGGMQQTMDDQSIKQFGVDTRNSAGQQQYAPSIVDAENVIIPDSNLQYRSGSIPMQIQNIDYESENNSIGAIPQQLNRSVPCINIIPSNSPPYMSTASMEQQINEILQGANTQEGTSENSNSKIINEDPQNNELSFDEAVHRNSNENAENISETCQSSSMAPSSENQQHHYSNVPIETRTNQTLAYSETQNLHAEDNRSPRSSPQNVNESQKCIPGVYKAMPMRSNSFKNTKPAAMVTKNDTNSVNPESDRRVPPNASTDATESSSKESNYANINPAEYHDYQNLSTMSRTPGLTGIIKNLNKDKQNPRSTNLASDKGIRNCVSFEDQSHDLKSNVSFNNLEFNHPQAAVCDTSQAKNPINTKTISSSETQCSNNIPIRSSVNRLVDSNSNASTNEAPLSVTKREDVGFHETKKSGVVSAMANTINRKEVISQQSLSSLPKPGHPVNVSTSKTYAISSLDDDSPIEKAVNTKLPAYKMETDVNYKYQTVGNGTTQQGGQFSSHAQIPQNESHIPTENQQFAAGTVLQKDIKNQLNSSNKQQQQQLDELESNTKGQGTDKRFQKVLPPFDKTHQLKSANRNTSSAPNPQTCPATSASSEQNSKSSTIVVQSNISKETAFSTDSSEMIPSLVQHNPEQIPVNIHKNDVEISKPPLALPPKPQSMSTGSPNAPLHSKSSSNKIASVTQHLINCISKTAPLESAQHVSNKEIMPDLLNRVALEEKTQLLLNEDKNLGDIENLKSEDKVLNYKIGLSNKIISPDQEKNYITESENTEPGSPKSPKKNSWFFGSHKNTLVLSVVIAKNPSIGFTVEGGIGTPKYPTRPADSGIYVSNVAADGPASGALRPGDKILQANGIDFSCLHLEKATSFLNTNEATLSLLISRE